MVTVEGMPYRGRLIEFTMDGFIFIVHMPSGGDTAVSCLDTIKRLASSNWTSFKLLLPLGLVGVIDIP